MSEKVMGMKQMGKKVKGIEGWKEKIRELFEKKDNHINKKK